MTLGKLTIGIKLTIGNFMLHIAKAAPLSLYHSPIYITIQSFLPFFCLPSDEVDSPLLWKEENPLLLLMPVAIDARVRPFETWLF